MTNLKWTIGNVEIVQIVEMEDSELFSSFIPEARPDKILEVDWLRPHFADENGKLKALVQSFLIKSNGKNILIDTCNGNGKERPNMPSWSNLKTNYLNKFTDLAITSESIDFVACTHLHFDHVGWNTKSENGKWVPTFPNAKYLFSKEEYDYWIKKPKKEMIDDFNGIDDSHQDWTTLTDTYPDQTVETRKKFLSEVKDKDVLIIGSHFANPVAGKVISLNDSYIFKV